MRINRNGSPIRGGGRNKYVLVDQQQQRVTASSCSLCCCVCMRDARRCVWGETVREKRNSEREMKPWLKEERRGEERRRGPVRSRCPQLSPTTTAPGVPHTLGARLDSFLLFLPPFFFFPHLACNCRGPMAVQAHYHHHHHHQQQHQPPPLFLARYSPSLLLIGEELRWMGWLILVFLVWISWAEASSSRRRPPGRRAWSITTSSISSLPSSWTSRMEMEVTDRLWFLICVFFPRFLD